MLNYQDQSIMAMIRLGIVYKRTLDAFSAAMLGELKKEDIDNFLTRPYEQADIDYAAALLRSHESDEEILQQVLDRAQLPQ